jgi:hypothetical protein
MSLGLFPAVVGAMFFALPLAPASSPQSDQPAPASLMPR